MCWGEQVFRYCERGQDPALWAEPFNALSNIGFLLVAGVVLARLRQKRDGLEAAAGGVLLCLTVLAGLVGVGSFLFHVFATRWSLLADVIPILLFMAAYLALALRVMLGLGWWSTAGILAVFVVATVAAARLSCPAVLRSVTDAAREPCLKGTMGYAPALLAIIVTGTLLYRRHAAANRLLAAAALFLASMILRWLDRDLCAATLLLGKLRGTHALWHLLNAGTVYLLLVTAIESCARPASGRSPSLKGRAKPQPK